MFERKQPCKFFLRNGRCRYGSSCRFSHSGGPASRHSSGDIGRWGRQRTSELVATTLFSLQTFRAQLAEKLGSGTIFSSHSDALVNFWPGRDRLEVLWKGFLLPPDFRGPRLVDSQTQALNFINSGLHALTDDHVAPQFLRELGQTEGRGVALIQALLDLKYSVDAGRQRNIVSFQRGLVPFVIKLTMRRMEMISQHMEEANYVYSFVRTAHAQLFRVYLEHLQQIVERHSIEDRTLSHSSFLLESQGRRYAPLCFTQLCLPFIRLLYLLGSKFNDFIYEDGFQETVNYLDALIKKWVDDSEENDDSSLDSALCFKMIKEEITRLHKMIRRGDHAMQTGAALENELTEGSDSSLPTSEVWNTLTVSVPEEGTLADGSVGPRHDNDHRDISKIQLLPTTEECSSREPPPLPGNFPFHVNAHWLLPGPDRWVDTHFRLYREDFCSAIRLCVQDVVHRLRQSGGNLAAGRVRAGDVDYNVYHAFNTSVMLKHTFSRNEHERAHRPERIGLCVDVRFRHPSLVKGDKKTRREFWEKTRRLPYNGMVAMVSHVSGEIEVVFCEIVQRDVNQLVDNVARISLQPYETSDFETLERWQHNKSLQQQASTNGAPHHTMLIEFNKVFLFGYQPVLCALQRIRPATMPFLEYLAPESPPQAVQMETPLYCVAPGFKFDLTSVVQGHPREGNDDPQQLHLYPTQETSREECETALVNHSTLERDQAKALVQALSSRVACIQGLPGTGKSFIGALLTKIIVEAKVTPVLIVCYTNHALDQFLCQLLDVGITKLVRVGGQCKEPRLDQYKLNAIHKVCDRYELKLLYQRLDSHASAISVARRCLQAQKHGSTWESLRSFLQQHFPNEYDYFNEQQDEMFGDNWEVSGCDDILEYWMKGYDDGTGPMLDEPSNVWLWNSTKRQAALSEWSDQIRSKCMDELVRAQEAYKSTLKKLEAVRKETDVGVLKGMQIIGMTTTGVAKNQQRIEAVAPPVVICEEAGEVLEAQVMACLSPACQQLVLIGDHKQLRPHIADYNLSVESSLGKRYALDVSLFERLVAPTSGLPFWMLTEQHRMRPQISQLLRMLFYPEVRDARETLEYPSLLGVDKNVFFVNHSQPEDGASDEFGKSTSSHSNEYEVEYIVATLKFLLQQGYQSCDIALLTPYVGQLMKIRSALKGEFVLELNELDQQEIQRTFGDDGDDVEDDTGTMRRDSPSALGATKKNLSDTIRAATVDNFQGEEATVILVSLVRSSTNIQGRETIGFLKIPNRINVLLSRAKHGLIFVGHGDLLRAKSPIWQQILDQLESDGCYGDGLPLHCQLHPDYQRVASNPSSFALLSPDGGCLRPCGRRLPGCGHACPKLCHVDQPSHKAVYCTQPCLRLQEGCSHVCPRVCGDPCGRCEVLVGSITLPCGHTYSNARCFEAKKPSNVRCNVVVEKLISVCGHIQNTACYITDVKCKRKCGAVLTCGHECSRTCSNCIEDTLEVYEGVPEPDFPIEPAEHGACRKKCERLLPCCHRCHGVCHGEAPCPPCQHICDVFSCEHASCNHPCSAPCAACTESCKWGCEHVDICQLPCGAPCNRKLCDLRCSKSLSCGHRCPSVCGEDCPVQEFCHDCGDEDVKQRVADVILFRKYGEIDPSKDPVLVLPCCSMVYTKETLDGTLHLSTYYNEEGEPRGALPGGYIDMPQCPNCSKPIRGLRRYGRMIKRAAIDAAEKKFITHTQHQLTVLQARVNAAVERGDIRRDETLQGEIRSFGLAVRSPPCQEVFEACVALLTKAQGWQGGGDVTIDQSALPVPNSTFRFAGYYYLFAAQMQSLNARKTLNNAEPHARIALQKFVDGSYSQQAREAKLVLVRVLLIEAEKTLNKSVKSEGERAERETEVEKFTFEAQELLNDLEEYVDFRLQHEQELQSFRRTLASITRRAKSATFYQEVSTEELRAVKTAMQAEFQGSGHWYRCVNGHSYSIGECGMAMERTTCPECGALVGGANHVFVEGTAHDSDMDSL
ncbi:hypothetical protein PHYSODRAFT_298238 [Phytophthora sojae]|uniref:Uncharacterized protein n=1 Tax=Phytophthora sojae (strain P6497) TaxID=1094619 RepID=G4ZAR9_PHYSP|nr:hypothetical protein PHYSODRAFT_298238 [Phytophthora sojae]EGZ19855.1 hypothetical protein PHYSODRAFT_298238 [Phytophthora sojae]|eukprot:XP_009522572.1 hypothetical protein PHYSODRAFT_298238 [Phytophthora sojae]